eukprot:GSChrysophyteH1.ASY1.ANO1.1169.1 assembled CDS
MFQRHDLSRDNSGMPGLFAVFEEKGLSFFPAYTGKIQETILPVLRDEEEEIYRAKIFAEELARKAELDAAKAVDNFKDTEGNIIYKVGADKGSSLWMPDKICKSCYNCEVAFTMYRRRHHCRMCGQIFCEKCSSNYIEGSMVKGLGAGLHRACDLCHELYLQEMDKLSRNPTSMPGGSYQNTGAETPTKTHRPEGRGVSIDVKSPEVRVFSDDDICDYQDVRKEMEIAEALDAVNSHRKRSPSYLSSGDALNSQDKALKSVEDVASSKPKSESKSLSNVHTREHVLHSESVLNRSEKHIQEIIATRKSAESPPFSKWKETIFHLVDAAVTNVDPDVRNGDSMDIRPYVKLKIIPGGKVEECAYVDGVVFRKNVSHRKMIKDAAELTNNPKILVLGGGIEFQRTDARLSTMDTLIEQEDSYLSILVGKIMNFKPDIILTGKSIARKAQDHLCDYKVAVIQNVRADLLERISRLTGAKMLPSTDHMLQHYNEDCLGACRRFMLKSISDDPERQNTHSCAQRILKSSIARGSTYVYLDGCPPELGCTIVLRGASRSFLECVKDIIQFGLGVAYHLRLEAAFHIDRQAYISPEIGQSILSDVDQRKLLSTSLDVDIGLPYSNELRGLYGKRYSGAYRKNFRKISTMYHQTILVSSLVMNIRQKRPAGKTEVLRIAYYTDEDISVGQFLIENCFRLATPRHAGDKDNIMLEQELVFSHRDGRIVITLKKDDEHSKRHVPTASSDAHDPNHSKEKKNPFYLPIYISSFCKVCNKFITKDLLMSDETWKMSFGKMMEIFLYNSSAHICDQDEDGRIHGSHNHYCPHPVRDCHIQSFSCEGFIANFKYVPIHAFSLHIRSEMEIPLKYHQHRALSMLVGFPRDMETITASFFHSISDLKSQLRQVFIHYINDEESINRGAGADSQNQSLFEQHQTVTSSVYLDNEFESSLHMSPILPETLENMTISEIEMKFSRAERVKDFTEIILIHDLLLKKVDDLDKDINASISDLIMMSGRILELTPTTDEGRNRLNSFISRKEGSVDSRDEKTVNSYFLQSPAQMEKTHQSTKSKNSARSEARGGASQEAEPSIALNNLPRMDSLTVGNPNAGIAIKVAEDNTKEDVHNLDLPNNIVPLEKTTIGKYRLDLTDGRKDEVIPVREDELASLIAYSLASSKYYDNLRKFFKTDISGENAAHETSPATSPSKYAKSGVNQLLVSQRVSHIKHKFESTPQYAGTKCKFLVVSHWALQFEAIRMAYFRDEKKMKEYIQSLAQTASWDTQGGKSGASFSKTSDDRFVCKVISQLELSMFIDFAPAYFEYMANAFYRDLPTVLCKILGVYTISYEIEGSKKITQNVVVMENIFCDRTISKTFDLKGSQRARYMDIPEHIKPDLRHGTKYDGIEECSQVLLDDNLLELTQGKPFPLKHRAKIYFDKAIANDTEFLSVVNVIDYSILIGFDEKNHEIVVGILDYIRQYDIAKKIESVGKSVGMIAGQAEPTIVSAAQYCRRFNTAMEKYFMAVPDHWSFSDDSQKHNISNSENNNRNSNNSNNNRNSNNSNNNNINSSCKNNKNKKNRNHSTSRSAQHHHFNSKIRNR